MKNALLRPRSGLLAFFALFYGPYTVVQRPTFSEGRLWGGGCSTPTKFPHSWRVATPGRTKPDEHENYCMQTWSSSSHVTSNKYHITHTVQSRPWNLYFTRDFLLRPSAYMIAKRKPYEKLEVNFSLSELEFCCCKNLF